MTASLRRHSRQSIADIARDFLSASRIDRSAYFYDLDHLEERLDHLRAAFPPSTLHAVAIKTQPSLEVLRAIVAAGHGLEAASFEEVQLAVRAGCPSDRIVFDSPAKTREELARCAAELTGMVVNVNSLEELDRIARDAALRVGIRINPVVATGAPSIYDVSDRASKFGVPIERREDIIQSAIAHDAVCGLHMHVGSEMEDTSAIVAGASRVVAVAEEIRARGKELSFIDIGGGVAARQHPGPQPGLHGLHEQLRAVCPAIERYQLITEYGRFVHAHNAFVLSRVEYVLRDRSPVVVLIHVGADLFVREIYSSAPPFHEMFLLDPDGALKEGGAQTPVAVMGPLCFAGDRFPGQYALAPVEEGDWLVVADCGANSLGMWSSHCSRTPPDWVSFRSGASPRTFSQRAQKLSRPFLE